MKEHNRHGHNPFAIDYYAYLSGMKRWNASYKVFFTMAALVTVISADFLPVSVMTLFYMGALTCLVGNVRLRDYIRLLLVPITFVLLSGIAILIQFGGGSDSLFRIPFFSTHLYITGPSVHQAACLSMKAMGAVSCLYLLTLSTPVFEILTVLKKLHLPNIILELMHFIYRYIFILLEMNSRQKDAVRARLGYCNKKTALRSFGNEMANLLVVSMNKARAYYDALESRGYEGDCLFWEEQRPFLPGQLKFFILYGLLAVILITLKYTGQ